MLSLLAQFSAPGYSPEVFRNVWITLIVGFICVAALSFAPTKLRRPIVWVATFLAGLYYILIWLWPTPVNLAETDQPLGGVEATGRWLTNAQSGVSSITQTLTALLLGLGVFSVLRLHTNKLMKKQKDWAFSLVLLLSMFTMIAVAYTDYYQNQNNPKLVDQANWGFFQYAKDFLFDGMLQAMDAAMFSSIAFFILFAAYRAFRIRSVESTVLLGTALIVMLSLMGLAEYYLSKGVIDRITGGNPGHFMNNFALAEISRWIETNVQGPGIMALGWGIGIGALSMGLRLWLSLEKSGGN
ncbi:MAG: hypothetical protein IT206_01720 [Fimbriimonadaceae bacterium]|nr:hypothetical protein [Fimbriimonadaceae bacterium]